MGKRETHLRKEVGVRTKTEEEEMRGERDKE